MKVIIHNFYCNLNRLSSLEGCPDTVKGMFDCSNNNLQSLKGCPKYVGLTFRCNYNHLDSLKYCPKYVGNVFVAYQYQHLTDFTKEEVLKYCNSNPKLQIRV